MANTINGAYLTRIAQLSLDALLTMELPLKAFMTDFSPDAVPTGNAVTTRYPNTVSVQDFSSNRSSVAAGTVARTVTLDYYVGVPLGFTDQEMSFSDIKLIDLFIKPALNALFENVMANVHARIKVAQFTQNSVITAANFTAANVAVLCQNFNEAKVGSNRHIICPPSYAVTLKKDTAVQASYAYGSPEAIRTGKVPDVYGFQVHEYNGTIPNNSENLAAYALAPQALLIAGRVPALPRNWYGEVRNVTAPDSGLTLQLRDYYDGVNGLQKTEMVWLFGTQIGNPGNLWRITSA